MWFQWVPMLLRVGRGFSVAIPTSLFGCSIQTTFDSEGLTQQATTEPAAHHAEGDLMSSSSLLLEGSVAGARCGPTPMLMPRGTDAL